MYLLDTNIILELLLEQQRAEEVEEFFKTMPSEELHLSRFSLYSLGIILLRRGKQEIFVKMVNDLLVAGGVRTVHLGAEGMADLVKIAAAFRLDFDDAYQYAVAENYDLTIVSFDSDFDRTTRGRKTPKDILDVLKPNTSETTTE